MRHFYALALAALLTGCASVFPEVPEPPTPEVIEFSEVSPELVGGRWGIEAGLLCPFREEPGTVVVRLVVRPNGMPTDVTVARSATPAQDAAAADAIQRASFTPGMQNGEAVAVRMSVPITGRPRS